MLSAPLFSLLALSLCIACTSPSAAHPPAPASKDAPLPRAQPASDSEQPVLVELFTSQGCSSCPPADQLLSLLDAQVDGEVIALSYHVDYWNDIGWRDPYSSAEATARQRAYARTIRGGRTYTPQLVVSGEAHVVASNKSRVLRAISAAQHAPASGVVIGASTKALVDGLLDVTTELSVPSGRAAPAVLLVLYENGLVTKVTRGENAGRLMRNDFVVRDIKTLARGEQSARFALDPSWTRDQLGVVAIAQDPKSLVILAADRIASLSEDASP